MKTIKKRIMLSLAIIIPTIVIISIIGVCVCALTPPDKNKMTKYFEQNQADLILIKEYLVNTGYEKISINTLNYNSGKISMFAGLENGHKVIDNDAVARAIERLFAKYNYSAIIKNDNIICFQKWTRLSDCGLGLAYSVDGNEPTNKNIEYLTHLEPLSEPNWFFYIDDYNEWRLNKVACKTMDTIA